LDENRINFKVDKDLVAEFTRVCKAQDMTKSQQLRAFMREYVAAANKSDQAAG